MDAASPLAGLAVDGGSDSDSDEAGEGAFAPAAASTEFRELFASESARRPAELTAADRPASCRCEDGRLAPTAMSATQLNEKFGEFQQWKQGPGARYAPMLLPGAAKPYIGLLESLPSAPNLTALFGARASLVCDRLFRGARERLASGAFHLPIKRHRPFNEEEPALSLSAVATLESLVSNFAAGLAPVPGERSEPTAALFQFLVRAPGVLPRPLLPPCC